MGCAHAPLAPSAPKFGNLGSHHRTVTTRSPEAQSYFDQGLNLLFGFNHDEAIRSFKRAAEIDPGCAMCFWGIAYANGPHINNPSLDAAHAAAAWAALGKAQALAGGASDVERGFIAALAPRYSADPKATRAPLDQAYAAAMRELWRAHPEDTDAGTLFAESLMDLRPWDLWLHDGKPQPGTEELVATLEAVLAKDPDHPGANHFYIHAVEASPHPEKGLAAAGRVAKLVPGAGHLVHMPAHIYIRVGRYADAAAANREAIQVDLAYQARAGPQGSYAFYMAHNFQFLWATDLWLGRSAEAAEAEAGMFKDFGPDAAKNLPEMVDLFIPYTYYRLVRFSQWDALLALAQPASNMSFANALWHFARGTALAAKGQLDDAGRELRLLEKAAPALADKAGAFMNSPRAIAGIAIGILAGDIAARRGDMGTALLRFTAATKAEDDLNYDEPADWILPARETLGRALLAAGRAGEAEAVYREDLEHNPENGWALSGLAQALEARKAAQAPAVRQRFEKAWATADVQAP
jgi:tetratricopeptide (TPR) repeat protein